MEIVTLESQSIYAHESCLGQYYILDNMSQKLDMQLDKYRSRDYQEGVFQDNYDCASSKSFLSSSYFGGARYLKNNAQDALTIVSEKALQLGLLQ